MRPDRISIRRLPALRTTGRRRRAAQGGVLALAAIVAHAAQAQDSGLAIVPNAADASGPTRTFSIVPSLSVSETLTDNGAQSADKRADAITQVSPGLHMISNGGRVKGYLDYTLTGILYANGTQGNKIQNALSAFANVEGIENTAFLDVNASISQQSISAFGTQSSDSALANNNNTEVRTLTLSPYLTGRLLGDTGYEARWTQSLMRASGDSASDNDLSRGRIRLDGPSSLTVVNWSADATHEAISYTEGRRTTDDIVRGLLHFSVTTDLRLTAIYGRESNDYASLEKETHSTPGWGIDWRPSDRTTVSVQRERRFFGDSHNYSLQHREPRSTWSYTDTRNIATNFGQSGGTTPGTAFDQFYSLFSSQIPDPAERQTFVNNYLQQRGISPNSQAFAGSLQSAVTLEHRQELSIALIGARNTISLIASRTESSRVDALSSVTDDFDNGGSVRQTGVALILSHQLTPLSSLGAMVSIDRTSGTLADQSTRLQTYNLNWTSQLGPHSLAGLGLRHAVFDSPSSPYIESAVIASLNLQF